MDSHKYDKSNRFAPGDRVEFHPGMDIWARGVRFGTVQPYSKYDSPDLRHSKYPVQPDRGINRIIWCDPDQLRNA